MKDYKNANLKFWDSIVEEHWQSDFYDVPSFLAGKTSLDPLEMEAVGDVNGRTLLRLQCHFGLSPLSWVRLGAIATGIDFSPAAITAANELSRKSGIHARFVESNIYNLSSSLDDEYDIVFASYGVLCWLPDLTEWAKEIAL